MPSESRRAGEQELFDDCMDLYRRTGAEVTYVWPSGRIGPYWASRFLQKIRRDHANGMIVEGVSAMVSKPAPEGFGIIEEAGRLDLSLELLVLDTSKPYHSFFSSDVVDAARQRMAVYRGRQEQARRLAD